MPLQKTEEGTFHHDYIADSTKTMLAKITALRAASQGKQFTAQPLLSAAVPVHKHAPAATLKQAAPRAAKATNGKGEKTATTVEFNEPNITERITFGGCKTYRVQICRRVDGKKHSLCNTFQHLKRAKKWRDKKLAENELHGFQAQFTAEKTIADVIADRLKRGKDLGRSAKQNLELVKNHVFGKKKVSTLTQPQLHEFAEELIDEKKSSANRCRLHDASGVHPEIDASPRDPDPNRVRYAGNGNAVGRRNPRSLAPRKGRDVPSLQNSTESLRRFQATLARKRLSRSSWFLHCAPRAD
ncbi:hypothetical protein [Defluviimonas sp. WL0075]|uniref:Uncharacterized protein n=1 Tax=Albidovulum sediminicola TaxID=2984331 RepID=A0ABT2Z628_9RHOB|nr:hypothetical protein [Defluviimonas sp. WL0075]MCV2866525.1 hypothetical protein [Defluviimonas sp. WL0075]